MSSIRFSSEWGFSKVDLQKNNDVKWDDVQGLVLSGYPKLPHAAYIPWRFLEPLNEGKSWLEKVTHRLTTADKAERSRSKDTLIATNLGALKAHVDDDLRSCQFGTHLLWAERSLERRGISFPLNLLRAWQDQNAGKIYLAMLVRTLQTIGFGELRARETWTVFY